MGRSACIAGMFLIGLFCLAVNAAERRDGDDWPTYGRNPSTYVRTITNSAITPNDVTELRPAWIFPTGDVVSASPAVVDDVVYTGSWDGYFYALDARSGQLKWKFRPLRAVNFGLFSGPPLGPLEERQDVIPAPAAITELRPVVVILRLAANVDKPVDRRRATEHAAARIGNGAAVGAGIGLGLEAPGEVPLWSSSFM